MRILALVAAIALGAASLVLSAPVPARANVFCPVTIAAVENLAILGRADTYGVMLDVDPGNATSVRLRVDSAINRYAVDFNAIPPAGGAPLEVRRYFVMPAGERVVAAWVEATGTSPDVRADCPITEPYAQNAPEPVDPAALQFLQSERARLRDTFSTGTPTAQPISFGASQTPTCAQPFAPPRAILPVEPDVPTAARAVHATGTVMLRVALDETSSVVDAWVVRSSGFAPLDRAAVTAAAKSSYRTESFDCRSVASVYQFTVTFGTGSAPP